MILRFLFVSICGLFIISCDPMDDRMIIKNNSNENIHIRMFIINGLIINETMVGIRDIPSNTSKTIGIISKWESEFDNLKNDTLVFVVYKDHSFLYDSMERSSKIKSDSLLYQGEYEYKLFSYDELKKNKWTIEYPNLYFQKGNNMNILRRK